MVERLRERAKDGPPGTRTDRLGSYVNEVTIPWHTLLWERVWDTIAVGNGLPFKVERYGLKSGSVYPTFTGEYDRLSWHHTYNKWPLQATRYGDWYMEHRPIGNIPSVEAAAADVVAKTNPSRPLVDIPVFALELRELPNMLLKRTNNLGRDIARGRLSLEYGWKPLINDLKNLLNFQKAFDERVRELDHLQYSGIRRKRKLFNGKSNMESDHWPHLENINGLDINGDFTTTSNCQVSGFVKWVPDKLPPRLLGIAYSKSQEDTRVKALAALTGISNTIIDASTIWELLPFSWLADWCSNAGDLLAANRNIVGAHPEKIQIMYYTYTEQRVRLSRGDDFGFDAVSHSTDDFTRFHETKQRSPVSSLELEAHYPFLNERRVAILSDIVRNTFNASKIDTSL